jgi:hypothetical protein
MDRLATSSFQLWLGRMGIDEHLTPYRDHIESETQDTVPDSKVRNRSRHEKKRIKKLWESGDDDGADKLRQEFLKQMRKRARFERYLRDKYKWCRG